MTLLIFLFSLVSDSSSSKIQYLFPCTQSCSCSPVVHKGWMIRENGKVFFREGERKDGKPVSNLYNQEEEKPKQQQH